MTNGLYQVFRIFYMASLLFLAGCQTTWYNPITWFTGGYKNSPPIVTEGGSGQVEIRPDGTIVAHVNQPENAQDEATIIISNVGTNDGENRDVTITIGGSSIPELADVSLDNWNYISSIGAGIMVLGILTVGLYIHPFTRYFVMTWKLGAGIFVCGLAMCYVSMIMQQYAGYIGLGLLAVGWYAWDNRNALLKEPPTREIKNVG